MMAQVTKYDDQLERKVREAELLNQQVALLQRVRDIELEIRGLLVPGSVEVTKTHNPSVTPKLADLTQSGVVGKRRGRPPGSTNKNKATKAPEDADDSVDDSKSVDLPTLLETIAQQTNRPLIIAEFVKLAREAGYSTRAKDFSNMVYQAVLKLTKKGTFKKNDETRTYEYVGNAA